MVWFMFGLKVVIDGHILVYFPFVLLVFQSVDNAWSEVTVIKSSYLSSLPFLQATSPNPFVYFPISIPHILHAVHPLFKSRKSLHTPLCIHSTLREYISLPNTTTAGKPWTEKLHELPRSLTKPKYLRFLTEQLDVTGFRGAPRLGNASTPKYNGR